MGGLYVVCIWSVCGMYVVCIPLYVPGRRDAHLWVAVKLRTGYSSEINTKEFPVNVQYFGA